MNFRLLGTAKLKDERRWEWPLNIAEYDRRPTLLEKERVALTALAKEPRNKPFAPEPWLAKLDRLLGPILDALKITHAKEPTHSTVVRILLREMKRRGCSFWKWKNSEWDGVLCVSMTAFARVHGVRGEARPQLMGLAILLRRIRDPRRFGNFDRIGLAKKIFGNVAVETAAQQVAETLKSWGFSSRSNDTASVVSTGSRARTHRSRAAPILG